MILTAVPEWEENTGACAPCSVCEDVVYGKGFQLVVKFPPISETEPEHQAIVKDCFLCQSCFDTIKDPQ